MSRKPLTCNSIGVRTTSLQFEQLETRRLLTAIDMTDREQLLLELVNRARANPAFEAARFGIGLNDGVETEKEIDPTPKQPLAPNPHLIEAARGHSDAMLQFDFFAHQNELTGKGPSERAQDAGYGAGAGENIAWAGDSRGIDENLEVYDRHQALFESPGHRVNMLRDRWREIGNGIRFGFFTEPGNQPIESIMVTENFGVKPGERFITGVAYTDRLTPDNFYSLGEGIAGMTVEAVRQFDGSVYTTTTGSSGGYSLKVPDGIYKVTSQKSGSGTVVVNHVAILDDSRLNQKVDFNTRNPNLGYIQGEVYEDLDEDGRRDSHERALANQTIYLDAIDDDRLNDHEFRIQTDSQGKYKIEGLRKGEYRVRIDAADSRTITDPSNEFYDFEWTSVSNMSHVDFGLTSFNNAPIAGDDEAQTVESASVVIDVTANDTDVDGNIDRSSVFIFQQPFHGQARVDESTGEVVYFPEAGYVGADVIGYTIRDEKGLESNAARVDILVTRGVGTIWQNQNDQYDVDADGVVAPIDVLVIVNDINEIGSRALSFHDALPPPFLDVNGDGIVTSMDALIVTNEINRTSVRNALPLNLALSSTDIAFASLQLQPGSARKTHDSHRSESNPPFEKTLHVPLAAEPTDLVFLEQEVNLQFDFAIFPIRGLRATDSDDLDLAMVE